MNGSEDFEVDQVQLEISEVESELEQIEEQLTTLLEKQHNLQAKKKQLEKLFKQQTAKPSSIDQKDWTKKDFSWSNKLDAALKDVFKISDYRPYQLETINATMSGKDCILIMPTGGGKSLCYQLPAFISNGITIVVSPLVSLMEDQVHCMEDNGLGHICAFFSASKTVTEMNKILKSMADKQTDLRLIFVTPEKIAKSKRFMSALEKMHANKNFCRLAIDEVHCISQWGHDFRPDYKILGIMKKQFPFVPILGLTATLTSKVAADVKTLLGISRCVQFKASFNRPNLNYIVRTKSSSNMNVVQDIADMLKENYAGNSGIIYCLTIKDSEEVACELEKRKILAAPYHAQLDPGFRSCVHSKWLSGELKVVVATIAFGMGINKPNVRFVVHHSISKSMENYYQESGRAGRDGESADCIIFYRLNDLFRLSTMVFKDYTGLENLYAMAAYCVSGHKCRRMLIADHFGEKFHESKCNKMCDSCRKAEANSYSNDVDVTGYCLEIYNLISAAKKISQRLTALKLLDGLTKKSNVTSNPKLTRESYEQIITVLLIEGYLKEDFHFTAYSVISYIQPGVRSMSVTSGKHHVKLTLPSYISQKISKSQQHKASQSNAKDGKTIKVPLKRTLSSKAAANKGVIFCGSSSDDDIEFLAEKKMKVDSVT